jgi:hypothetical protein
LLINFGEMSLNFKRLTNKKYKSTVWTMIKVVWTVILVIKND